MLVRVKAMMAMTRLIISLVIRLMVFLSTILYVRMVWA
jgi:hypothetical protein